MNASRRLIIIEELEMMTSQTHQNLVTALREHLIWIIFLAAAIALRALATL
jgi:hypothetical protein